MLKCDTTTGREEEPTSDSIDIPTILCKLKDGKSALAFWDNDHILLIKKTENEKNTLTTESRYSEKFPLALTTSSSFSPENKLAKVSIRFLELLELTLS